MRIVIDTDPGQDDAAAILLALASPGLEVAAITAVAGNVGVAQAASNARRILDLARRDLPVFAGAAGPLVLPLETAEFVCGPDGLDGHALPPPSVTPPAEHAALALIRLAGKGPLTICALGPLTNIALALRLSPGLPVDRILWMGGALGLGNMTPAAEFNAYVDPHALDVVLGAGIKLTIFGLQVTHQAVPVAGELDGLAAGSACARAVHAWMTRPRPGGLGSSLHPWHDPCVIAGLLWPELFTLRACHVGVAAEAGPLRGRTTIDWNGRLRLPPNAEIVGGVEPRGLFSRITGRLLELP